MADPTRPVRRPSRPPAADNSTASTRKTRRICRGGAPTALGRPTSGVCPATQTSVTLIMPMPASDTEIAAIPATAADADRWPEGFPAAHRLARPGAPGGGPGPAPTQLDGGQEAADPDLQMTHRQELGRRAEDGPLTPLLAVADAGRPDRQRRQPAD